MDLNTIECTFRTVGFGRKTISGLTKISDIHTLFPTVSGQSFELGSGGRVCQFLHPITLDRRLNFNN